MERETLRLQAAIVKDPVPMDGPSESAPQDGAERRELIDAAVEQVEFDAERLSVPLAFHDLGIRALSEVAA